MKKLILTCAVIASASVVSMAQTDQSAANHPATMAAAPNAAGNPAPTPEFIAGRRAEMFQKQLNLTPEQYKGVYQAELGFMKQMFALRASGKQPEPGEFQKMIADKDNKYKKILTPEQFEKYQASSPRSHMHGAGNAAGK